MMAGDLEQASGMVPARPGGNGATSPPAGAPTFAADPVAARFSASA
jgi:hypothetical protein